MIILRIVFYLFLLTPLFSQKIEITSTSMEAKNLKKEIHFIGNAKIKKNNDWLHADKIIVYFNENNETKKYEAIGNVAFLFKNEKSFYKGSASKVIYHPLLSRYILFGNAMVSDVLNKREIKGNEIMLNILTGNAKVKGSKQAPIKFIFEMENTKQ